GAGHGRPDPQRDDRAVRVSVRPRVRPITDDAEPLAQQLRDRPGVGAGRHLARRRHRCRPDRMAARTAMTAPTSVLHERDTHPDGADLSHERLRSDRTLPEVVAAIAAVVAVVVVTAVMLRRVGHPYELEWLEGGSVEHVQRVLHGRSLYPAPSVDFVSYPYPPLYWWASAGAASVLGVGFLPLRLVSLIASLATMALLGA